MHDSITAHESVDLKEFNNELAMHATLILLDIVGSIEPGVTTGSSAPANIPIDRDVTIDYLEQ